MGNSMVGGKVMSSFHVSASGVEAGLRWTARLLAAILVGLVLVIYIGEGGLNPLKLRPVDALQKTHFLTACIGLGIAWRWPLLGGAISTVGMLLFFATEVAVTGRLPNGLVFPLILVTGMLFLLSACIRRRMSAG
jgi:hypothetical protein